MKENQDFFRAFPKNMWLASDAFEAFKRDPPAPIFFNDFLCRPSRRKPSSGYGRFFSPAVPENVARHPMIFHRPVHHNRVIREQ